MAAINTEHNLRYAIVAQSEDVFHDCVLRLPESHRQSAIWCDPARTSRADVINSYPGGWIFFLDHDCTVTSQTHAEAASIIRKCRDENSQNSGLVIAGRYKNPERSGWLQRFQNFVANTWVEGSYQSPNPFVLGGAFMVRKNAAANLPQADVRFWGAEDKLLSYSMADIGMRFIDAPNLEVIHQTASGWGHFFRRAYLHGLHDAQYVRRKSQISYRFWICKIGVANLNLLPLVVLHFCIQRAALLFQKVRQ